MQQQKYGVTENNKSQRTRKGKYYLHENLIVEKWVKTLAMQIYMITVVLTGAM